MGDKSEKRAILLILFWHVRQRTAAREANQINGGSQTSLMLATINETMMPYMTPCPDLEIIHQSETLLHHKQCPKLLQEDAFSNGPPQLYIIDGAYVECGFVLSPAMDTRHASPLHGRVASGWRKRGEGNPGLGDSSSSHRVAANSSITLRGAASIINK